MFNDDFNALLRTPWDAEQWILEGWNTITVAEQASIRTRLDQLFANGLPFTLTHEKLPYIYTFACMAQLEVLAIQIPLKFDSAMTCPDLKQRLRQQLLDEIFHGLVFTKIVYLLCEPAYYPPPYNTGFEQLCQFVREETCLKTALVLLNLVAEGWIEEIFRIFAQYNIAPDVFHLILEDETRHVSEADLYRTIGLPDRDIIQSKITALENQLLHNVFLQDAYMLAIATLIGAEGVRDFMQALEAKHQRQLQKIGLLPSPSWQSFIATVQHLAHQLQTFGFMPHTVPMTALRQTFMTQWDPPGDPTMVGMFDIDISSMQFFSNPAMRDVLTIQLLRALSDMADKNPALRHFLHAHRLYCAEKAYVGLVVKLPHCGDQLGMVVFENAHGYTPEAISERITHAMRCMMHCYQKRLALEQSMPALINMRAQYMMKLLNAGYSMPLLPNPVIALSNIGVFGYQGGQSPLRKNEALKFTAMAVERKPFWNTATGQFEPRDYLPISCSADHRVFDGNIPLPNLLRTHFAAMLAQTTDTPCPVSTEPMTVAQLDTWFAQLETENPELLYGLLLILHTQWMDFISVEEITALEACVAQHTS